MSHHPEDDALAKAKALTDAACTAALAAFTDPPGRQTIAPLAVIVVYHDNASGEIGFRLRQPGIHSLAALDNGDPPTEADVDREVAGVLREVADSLESARGN